MSTSGSSVSTSSSMRDAVILINCNYGRKVYRVKGQNFDLPKRYSITDVLGSGSYGLVVQAEDEHTGEEVAIKRVGHIFDDPVDGRRMWRELTVFQALNRRGCRNLIKMHGCLKPRDPLAKAKDVYMVLELCETDLHYACKKIKPFELRRFKKLTIQILHCISDMHALGIIHRDIKPSNILLANDEQDAKVCDLGLARGGLHVFNEDITMTDYVVTRWYRAPELLLLSHYHLPVDLWSVGCVLAEYIMHMPLFAGKDYLDQLRLVLSKIPLHTDPALQAMSPQSAGVGGGSAFPPTSDNGAKTTANTSGIASDSPTIGSSPGSPSGPEGTGMDFLKDRSCIPFLKELSKQYYQENSLGKLLPSHAPPELKNLLESMLVFNPLERATANDLLAKHPLFTKEDAAVPSTLTPDDSVDWRYDNADDFSELRLRRKMWEAINGFLVPLAPGEAEAAKRQQ